MTPATKAIGHLQSLTDWRHDMLVRTDEPVRSKMQRCLAMSTAFDEACDAAIRRDDTAYETAMARFNELNSPTQEPNDGNIARVD